MPTKSPPYRLLRKFVWWLGLFLTINVAFYIVIPLVAANYIKRHLEAQGYTDVAIDLGYPSPRRIHMPFLSLQKDLAEEHLSLTIRNLEITYLLTELLTGHLRNIAIERISLELTVPRRSPQPAEQDFSQPPRPDPLSPLTVTPEQNTLKTPDSQEPDPNTLVSMAKLLPVLPVESFSLEKVSIFRAGATGPFRRMEMSGSLENREGELKGIMTFRGEKVIPYSLLVSLKSSGDISVILRSNELLSVPLFVLDSRLESSQQEGISMWGTVNADLKQLTPFLALFMPLGSDLHKVDGYLHADWKGSTAHDVTPQTLFQDAATTLSGTFQLDLHLPAWAGVAEDIEVVVNGQITALPEELTVHFSMPTGATARIRPGALQIPSWVEAFLVDSEDQLILEVKDHVTTTLSFKEKESWGVEGFLRAKYGNETSPLGVQLTLLRASGDQDSLLETEGQLHSWGNVYHLPSDWPEVERLEWDIQGNVTSTDQRVELQLTPDSFISSTDLQQGLLHIPGSIIRLEEPWRILFDNHTREWRADFISLPIGLPRIYWGGTETEIEKTVLHISQFRGNHNSWELNGKVILGRLAVKGEMVSWPLIKGGIGFWVNPQHISLGVRVETLDKSFIAQSRLEHNFQTNQGDLFATLTPQPFSESRHRLSHMLTPWSYPFDVTSGEMSGKVSVVWEADRTIPEKSLQVTRGEFALSANHIGGSYHGVQVEDASATLVLLGTGLEDVAMPVPAAVTIGTVQQGIMAKGLSFSLQLGFDGTTMIPTLDIKDFSAGVFGGRITSPRIYLDTTQDSNAFVLKMESLKLDQILRLEQQPNLEGSGVLNGFVPITLQDGHVEIREGKIQAQPPGGVIRFAPLEDTKKKLSQSNFNMDVVLRALTNFHYDTLSVGVNYVRDGLLQLHAKLEGKNPDIERGVPIHFNLNIEENIPALLQSLSVMKTIEQQAGEVAQRRLP